MAADDRGGDGGIRAEVCVETPTGCPTTVAVSGAGTTTTDVTRSTSPTDGTVTEEFLLHDPIGIDLNDLEDVDTEFSAVFDYGEHVAWRFERDRDVRCPCETVANHGCPVADVTVQPSLLRIAFHAPDMATLQRIIADLKVAFDGLDVERLLRSTGDAGAHDLVFVDRGRLTMRQREVLQVAHDNGYFDHPKGANAGEIASDLGITRSTFTEHLAAAQSKLLDAILD